MVFVWISLIFYLYYLELFPRVSVIQCCHLCNLQLHVPGGGTRSVRNLNRNYNKRTFAESLHLIISRMVE